MDYQDFRKQKKFERLAREIIVDTHFGDTEDDGYTSSETVKNTVYSPALKQLAKNSATRNAAVQTPKRAGKDKGTQTNSTEAEALPRTRLPLPAPHHLLKIVLALVATNHILALIAGIPAVAADPNGQQVKIPLPQSLGLMLFWYVLLALGIGLINTIFQTVTAARYPTIPDLPEPTTAAVTAFCVALATAAAY